MSFGRFMPTALGAPGTKGSGKGSGGQFRGLRRGLMNLLFGGVVMNLLRGQFQPDRQITGSATAGQPRARPARGQVGGGPPGMEMPRPSGPGQQDQQAPFRRFNRGPARQLPARRGVETPGEGIPDITGPVNPSVPPRTGPKPGEGRTPHPIESQELDQFTFPGGNVLKFRTGSAPAMALTALVETITGASQEGLSAADIYGVIGAAPEDPDSFMQALTLRWQEAMAASFGDLEAAKNIFRNSLITEATPMPETFEPADIFAGLGGGAGPGTPAVAAEEFDPQDFLIDPGLLFSSETSGEDFF